MVCRASRLTLDSRPRRTYDGRARRHAESVQCSQPRHVGEKRHDDQPAPIMRNLFATTLRPTWHTLCMIQLHRTVQNGMSIRGGRQTTAWRHNSTSYIRHGMSIRRGRTNKQSKIACPSEAVAQTNSPKWHVHQKRSHRQTVQNGM